MCTHCADSVLGHLKLAYERMLAASKRITEIHEAGDWQKYEDERNRLVELTGTYLATLKIGEDAKP